MRYFIKTVSKNLLRILPSGNCPDPECNYKIKIVTPEGTIYKSRLFIKLIANNEIVVKCTGCKKMLVDYI
jgi:hypothetical protein